MASRSERKERKQKKRDGRKTLGWVIAIVAWALALILGWQAGRIFFG